MPAAPRLDLCRFVFPALTHWATQMSPAPRLDFNPDATLRPFAALRGCEEIDGHAVILILRERAAQGAMMMAMTRPPHPAFGPLSPLRGRGQQGRDAALEPWQSRPPGAAGAGTLALPYVAKGQRVPSCPSPASAGRRCEGRMRTVYMPA